MLSAQSSLRPITGAGASTDQANTTIWISSSRSHASLRCHLPLTSHRRNGRHCCRQSKSTVVISCKASRGSFGHGSSNGEDHGEDDDYVEAVVLVSETIRHYRMLVHGFREETIWQLSTQLSPFPGKAKDRKVDIHTVGTGFLRHFKSPTIFLKISCDGDFVLPIIVGEYAVEKLIESLYEEENGDCPNQFQLMGNLLWKLGYEVKMVRITERVLNTYFARIFFHKPGVKDILSVDARPSDAINVAKRCSAPILVNKQIFLTDALRIVYGMEGNSKCVYDVSLDSASDGPDFLSEELNMVKNMNLAVNEERYEDAAMWRDKLLRIRESKMKR